MNTTGRKLARGIGIAAIALVIAGLGFALGVFGTEGWLGPAASEQAVNDVAVEAPMGAPVRETGVSESAGGATAPAAEEDLGAASVSKSDTKIIRTAGVEIRVEEIEPAIAEVRSAATRNNAEITELSVTSGNTGGPIPLEDRTGEAAFPSPATAYITMRVPAQDLDKLQKDVAEVGTVVSQSASASDVTQEHIDLSARLKNLRAQEARLRTFFNEATKVSELLAIENELARVRGEIEAMQAQLDYLDRQVARATLTVTLTEPGPVVRPSSGDWGFLDAITRGVQGAARVLTTLITVLIALAPVIVLALLAWLVFRAAKRRREGRTKHEAAETVADEHRDEGA